MSCSPCSNSTPCTDLRPDRGPQATWCAYDFAAWSGYPLIAALSNNPTWQLPFSSSCQRLRDFASRLDEKLCDGAECAVLQGDYSDRHGDVLQLNGQDLDSRTLRKSHSQY